MTEPLLHIFELAKSYRLGEQEIPVLQELNLDVDSGEMVVIMGPSGSGKTTLLNCVSGIDQPVGGSISIHGNAIDFGDEKARTRLRRTHVGMVFQFFNLIPTLTVEENIGLPFLIAKEKDPERVAQLLQDVGMEQRRNHLPFQLSGGEMQLVSIARALVHRPSLLLADEPTGNVNPEVGRSIMQILRTAAKHTGTGVLMVTHSPEHAAWADRVCFLKNGAIAAQLKHDGNAEDPSPIHTKLLELGI